jgi:hypothetical protein
MQKRNIPHNRCNRHAGGYLDFVGFFGRLG